MRVVGIQSCSRALEQEDRTIIRRREHRVGLVGAVREPTRVGTCRTLPRAPRAPVDVYLARVGQEVPGQQVQDRPRARTLGAAECEQLPPVGGEGDPLDQRAPAPAHAHITGFECGHRRFLLPEGVRVT